ncbi:tRNA pseudouridine(13) synthase TruD [Candidatus Woesearchaeota archaeon]|nr:tRNA pseudouridine(13) synthase TruD [Candidatus Woesearchaeota archaeon]
MKIKTRPEDFKVTEKYALPTFQKQGGYAYVLLEKRNYNLMRAVQVLSRLFGISEKEIGYAGIKDKCAITQQYITLHHMKKEKILCFHTKDISLTFLGYAILPITLGSHTANHFEIVIRDLQKKPEKKERYINYFGTQRFSSNNAAIGKDLILKNYQKALTYIQEQKNEFKKEIEKHLEKNPQDVIGALHLLPIRFLKLYVHAYQAELWNRTLDRYLFENKEEKDKQKKIPLLGFGYTCGDEHLKKIIASVMKEEQIQERDFINKQFPALSIEGTERNLFMELHDFSLGELEEDELHPEKKKVRIQFTLGKGSYATEVIRQLFSQ